MIMQHARLSITSHTHMHVHVESFAISSSPGVIPVGCAARPRPAPQLLAAHALGSLARPGLDPGLPTSLTISLADSGVALATLNPPLRSRITEHRMGSPAVLSMYCEDVFEVAPGALVRVVALFGGLLRRV